MPCMAAAEPSAAGSSPGYAYFGICVGHLPLTGTTLHRPGPQIPVLSTAGPTARSVADLRLMLQVICGRHGHGPAVPPVPWRQAGPTELAGPHAAYWPGFPP